MKFSEKYLENHSDYKTLLKLSFKIAQKQPSLFVNIHGTKQMLRKHKKLQMDVLPNLRHLKLQHNKFDVDLEKLWEYVTKKELSKRKGFSLESMPNLITLKMDSISAVLDYVDSLHFLKLLWAEYGVLDGLGCWNSGHVNLVALQHAYILGVKNMTVCHFPCLEDMFGVVVCRETKETLPIVSDRPSLKRVGLITHDLKYTEIAVKWLKHLCLDEATLEIQV